MSKVSQGVPRLSDSQSSGIPSISFFSPIPNLQRGEAKKPWFQLGDSKGENKLENTMSSRLGSWAFGSTSGSSWVVSWPWLSSFSVCWGNYTRKLRELLQYLPFFECRILRKAQLYREQLYRRSFPLESVSSGGNSLTREERNCPFGKWTHVPG